MSSIFRLAAPESAAAAPEEALPPAALRMDFFYPHIQVGVTEPVLVTQVLDPRRVFCQLRSLSHEVQRLSESMHHYYELQAGYGDASMQHSFILGQPCASRGPDGCWYRSLLQEYIPDRRLAAVIHVDWGRRDVVPMTGLRSLAPDFFRMPVVTFPCSLYGVSDRGSGWDPAQVFELRSLLYGRQLTAKIEFYNSYEHLYVVNLFGDDGFNVNRLFDMRAHTLKVCQANRLMADGPVPVEEVCGNGKARVADVPKQQFYVPATPTQELKVGKFYDAFVEFVCDPSRFWIRIAENASNYSKVVNGVTRLYSQASKLDGIIPKPQRGQLCCTKFKDNQYYRAEVVATHEKKVTVYFIDYGNSETVDWYNVKELPAQFRDIPGSAIRCCLADIHPLGEEWSSEAIAAFKVAVVDKKLVIYIVCKESDNYTVEVLDQSRIEERSIGKVLADAGHAKFESHEPVEELPKLITAMAIGKENDVQLNDAVSSKKSHKTRQREPVPNRAKGDKAKKPMCSPFEDQFFEPGATIEVVVSSVDHPGLFWCQNVAHASDLNHLMNKIQEYCSSTSCPSDRRSSSCLARSPSDGQWYRGFVTETPVCASDSETVEVLYVDYGRKEMVPARDLRSIKSEFFNLKAQAFRCSLYNIIAPLGKDPFCWDAKATGLFNEFVEGASGKSVPFCCMFFAVASMDDEMFNIVDLFTPFTSVCNLLVERRHATPLSHKTLDPSVQLHSYFYSMHDIKIGCEEEIYVTHTNRSLEFYCQLSRNAGTVDEISSVVARASSKAQESKAPLGPLCLARFTDKQWYRGFICSNSSNPEVFFVDFGNTDKVNDKDLLPIKQNEYELLLFPMQAIKCSLSDVPPNVPSDIVSWFEKTVLDKPLRAIIVAKETDGKLIVELYSGNRQINTSIKSKLGLRSQKDTANALLHSASDNVRNGDTKKRAYNASKGETRDPGQRFYQVNSKRDESRSSQSVSRNAAPRQKADSAKDRMLSSETKPVLSNKSPQMRSFGDKLYKASPPQIKLKDLPKRNLFPGLQFPVYISHINSIYDFSVQIAQDAELCEISKILNETSKPEKVFEKDVQAGDLVCAFFADDELNYRAVVTEKSPDGLHVEYVDYGNTSVVPVSKVARLPEKLLSYPVMSFHCTLNRQSFGTSDDDLLHKFTERTNDLQLCCEFLRQCGDRWEVRLSDQQGSVTDFLTSSVSEEPPSAEPTDDLPANDAGDTTENVTSRDSFVWNLPQRGETVDVYVSAVDSPEHFWCQLTTSDVDGLAVKVQEAGELSIVDDCFISAIEVGSPCNVMYSDDNNWYRAAVTRIEAGLITVRFVDYGNEETVKADHVRQLPSALTTIPVVAFPCCLAGFNLSDGCWNSDANTFFYNRVTEDSLEITVVGIQPPGIGNIPMVSVSAKYKGEDINEEMRPFWCVGTDRGASASLTEDTKARCDSLEFETVSDTSLPDSDAPGDNIQENVDPQGNDEQEKQVAGDRECSGPWISSQGEAAIETGDGEERSPGYLFFNTRQDEAAAGDRAASQEDDMRAKDTLCTDSLATRKSSGAYVGYIRDPFREPELSPVTLGIPEDVQRNEMHLVQDLSGEEELMRSLHGVGFTEAGMHSITSRESSVNLTDSCLHDSFSEPNETGSELCDADIKVSSPSLQEDCGNKYLEVTMSDVADIGIKQSDAEPEISTYVEYPVPEDSTNEITETDVSNTSDLESQDIYTCAERVDPDERIDLYMSDIYESGVAIPESKENQSESNKHDREAVYAESSVSEFSSSIIDTSDPCEAATLDLESTENPDHAERLVILDTEHRVGEDDASGLADDGNQDHTDRPAPFTISEYTEGFREPDADYPETADKRVPAEDGDAVYASDVCDSKGGDLGREDPQDLYEPLYTKCDEPMENPDCVYKVVMESEASNEDGTDVQIPELPERAEPADNAADVLEPQAGDLGRLENQDVSESPAPDEHEDAEHTCDVCDTGDGGLETDLLVYPEDPTPVGSIDNLYTTDSYDAAAGDLDAVQMEGWPVNTESPAPVDNTDQAYRTEADKAGAGDLEREDSEGITLHAACLMPAVTPDHVYEADTYNADGLETKGFQSTRSDAVCESDVSKPEAGDRERLDNQDVPAEHEDVIHPGDDCGPEGGDLERDWPLNTESPAPVDDTERVTDVSKYGAGDLEREDDDGLTLYTECLVPVESPGHVYDIDTCNPDTSSLGSTETKDLAVVTESPVPADATDNQESDAYCPETGDLDGVDNHDIPVNAEHDLDHACDGTQDSQSSDPGVSENQGLAGCTESEAPSDSPDSVLVIREPESGDPESIKTQEVPVYPEHPAAGSTVGVFTSDVYEPESGDLEQVESQDAAVCAESPAPVSTTNAVYMSDECEPEAAVLEREDNRELLYTETPAAVDFTDRAAASPICDLERGDDQDLLVHSENPAPVEAADDVIADDVIADDVIADDVYTCDVYEWESGDPERAESPDAALYTEAPASAGIMCVEDVGEPDSETLQEGDDRDCSAFKEDSHPGDGASQLHEGDAEETELQSVDNFGLSPSCDPSSLA